VSIDVWLTLLLVFARLAAFVVVLPVLSMKGVPKYVGLFIAMGMTVLVGPHVPVAEGVGDPVRLIIALGGEILLGFGVGTGIAAMFSALTLASEISAQQTGFAMMTLFNPVLSTREGPLGILAAWLAGWGFLASGMHLQFLILVSDSFSSMPPGAATLGVNVAWSIVRHEGDAIALGVQLAGPVITMVFLVNAFVGMLTRLAPRMNVFFSIGMSLTGTTGIALFALSLPWMMTTHAAAMRHVFAWAVNVLGVK